MFLQLSKGLHHCHSSEPYIGVLFEKTLWVLSECAHKCQGGPWRSPEIQSTLVWSLCWGATGGAGHNKDVVPYNPYLSAKYDCHINVEVCAPTKAVKYIHKYIDKGPDMATIRVGQTDELQGAQHGNNAHGQGEGETLNEVKQYLNARYIGPVEACWRLFEFTIHLELPSVYRLPVHLEDEQQVIWREGANAAEQERAIENSHKTHLTQWFVANGTLPDAVNYTYQEFPQHFVWVAKQKLWKSRERGFCNWQNSFCTPNSRGNILPLSLTHHCQGCKELE